MSDKTPPLSEPLTSMQIESLIADLLEVRPEYDLGLHYQLVEQIAALERELAEAIAGKRRHHSKRLKAERELDTLEVENERLKDWISPDEPPEEVETCYGIVKLGGFSGEWWFEGNAPICWRRELPFDPPPQPSEP
jgi:hypothetical protein